MEFYLFVRGLMAWMASIACLFPLNVPLLYLAHRVREGSTPEDDRLDGDELWTRSLLGSLGVAVVTVAFLFLDVLLADWMALPPGNVHFVIVLAYVPTAAFVLAYVFAFEDYFFGLSLLTLYLMPPVLVLYAINALLPIWGWMVNFYLGFLKEIPA